MHSLKSFGSIILIIFAMVMSTGAPASAGQVEYVIVISVDGGGSSYIQRLIDLGQLPNFRRFQTEGAWTNNARNDYDYTITLPNHITMITGLAVLGNKKNGHLWTGNTDPSNKPKAANYSLQNNKGAEVFGVFGPVHDRGLRTALYATKTKFSLFAHSYNSQNVAPDNRANKIDAYVYNAGSAALTAAFSAAMKANPYNFVLVHYTDGDSAGHGSGWGSPSYNNALKAVDGYLGSIFTVVTGNARLKGKTAIILTADHGGNVANHADNVDPLNYTIPFYVWGPDVEPGADLYKLNPVRRLNPAARRPAYTEPVQPIRNGEAANLALGMLSLPALSGSTINAAQDLMVNFTPPDIRIISLTP